MTQDYYELLSVSREADGAQIKTAYRKLALKYHPDRNPGDQGAEEQFKAINEAYAVLSDPEKRSHYDRFGKADPQAQFSGDIFDIFASVFGGGFTAPQRSRSRGQQGEDLQAEIAVSLEQARDGATVEIGLERMGACDHCHGDRAEPGGKGRQACVACGGLGQVRAQAQSIFGTVMTTQTCPRCRGAGEIIAEPCTKCNGRGRRRLADKVEVSLPKGIDAGYRVRVPQQGNAGVDGGPPGDLYVYIELEPHEQLSRDGDHLRYTLELGLAQAALGCAFTVPTLDGLEPLTVPPGTQPGSEFRLRGKGMPRLRQLGMGDLIVTTTVRVPGSLSPKARELLLAYAEETGEAVEEPEGLLGHIKGFFGRKKDKQEKKGDKVGTGG
jgi:molecular chaperone DnaJ